MAFALAACVGPTPTPTTTVPTPWPSEGSRPLLTPSPYQGPAVNGLVTYHGPLVSFEYPAEWREITGSFQAYHYYRIEAVVGTGDWTTGCIQYLDLQGNVNGESCSGETFDVGPGEVVVEMLTADNPAGYHATAPPATAGIVDGLPYSTVTSGSRTTWRIYNIPNDPPLDVIAEFGEQPSATARRQVEALIASIRRTN